MPKGKRQRASRKPRAETPAAATETQHSAEPVFTDKQMVFIAAYVAFGEKSFLNGTESARRAGYSTKTARQIATENLSKLYIRDEINRRLRECMLSAEEVLARVSMHARGTLAPFVRQTKGGDVELDLTSQDAQAAMPLLKSISFFKKSGGSGDKYWEQTQTRIEIHDAHAANALLGKYHKLWVERNRTETWEDDVVELVNNRSITLDEVSVAYGREVAERIALRANPELRDAYAHSSGS